MVFIDRVSGECRRFAEDPGPPWDRAEGAGHDRRALFRRREGDTWRAVHAFAPDAPLWTARAWEQVYFRPAAAAVWTGHGASSQLTLALAPRDPRERDVASGTVWVILPGEPGVEAPAGRPGAQAIFRLDDLHQGASPGDLAGRLLTGRIIVAGLPVEQSRFILSGRPVSPDDARILRRLSSILALATRLSQDLEAAAVAYPLVEVGRPAAANQRRDERRTPTPRPGVVRRSTRAR